MEKSKWEKWDGAEDLGRVVLVKTDTNVVCTAQQLGEADPNSWLVYVPGTPLLFQPALNGRVVEYLDLKSL